MATDGSVPLFPQELLCFAGELPYDLACRFHTFPPAYAFTGELTHCIDVACRCREEREGREMRHRDLDMGSPGADPPTDDVALESFRRFDRRAEDPVRRIPAVGKRLRKDGVPRFGGDELLEVGGMGLGFGRRDESRPDPNSRRAGCQGGRHRAPRPDAARRNDGGMYGFEDFAQEGEESGFPADMPA